MANQQANKTGQEFSDSCIFSSLKIVLCDYIVFQIPVNETPEAFASASE